jgi:hypothetical protein
MIREIRADAPDVNVPEQLLCAVARYVDERPVELTALYGPKEQREPAAIQSFFSFIAATYNEEVVSSIGRDIQRVAQAARLLDERRKAPSTAAESPNGGVSVLGIQLEHFRRADAPPSKVISRIGEDEKLLILHETMESIALGESEAEKTWRNVALHEVFEGRHTRAQIGAVSAYVKIRAARMLKDLPAPTRPYIQTVEDFVRWAFAWTQQSTMTHRHMFRDLVDGTALSDSDRSNLEELLGYYHAALVGEGALPSMEKSRSRGDGASKLALATSVAEGTAIKDIMGHATKQKWRRAWAAFLEERIPMEKRKNQLVVCLGGPELLEVLEVYLPLGVPADRIISIERDSEVIERQRARIQSTPQLTGLKLIEGNLEEIMPGLDNRLGQWFPDPNPTIISLDMCGQMSDALSVGLRTMPVRDSAFVLVNVKGNRETQAHQGILQEIAARYASGAEYVHSQRDIRKAVLSGAVTASAAVRTLHEAWELFSTDVEQGVDAMALSELRDAHVDHWILHQCGADRLDLKSPLYPRLVQQHGLNSQRPNVLYDELHQLCGHVAKLLLSSGKRLGTNIRATELPFVDIETWLVQLAFSSLMGHPRVHALEKWKYRTETRSHAPFLSVFAEVHFPRRTYDQWSQAASFAHKAAAVVAEVGAQDQERGEGYLQLKLEQKTKNAPLSRADQIVFLVDGKRRAWVQLGRLIEDCIAYRLWADQYQNTDSPSAQARIRRMVIEDLAAM